MKTCPNCRAVHPDDYAGQCPDCGRGLGDVRGTNSGDLAFRYANQMATGRREGASETAMRRGSYDGVPLTEGLIDKAREFITFDPSKVKEREE